MGRILLALLMIASEAAVIAAEKIVDMLGAISLPECDGTGGSYPAGSLYAKNVDSLISGLIAKASSSPALFASGSTGEGEEETYGVVVCHGDVTSEDCFDCDSRAIQDLPVACNRSLDAALLYSRCYIRIAAKNFLASSNNNGLVIVDAASSPSTISAAGNC